MLFKLRKSVIVMAIIVISALLLNSALFAAPAANGAVFGVVDMEAVFNGAQKKKDNEVKFQAMVTQMQQKIDLRQKNRLLNANEYKELSDLSTKANPTAQDTAKINELLNLSKTRDQELQTLQQKRDATDADKARLNSLQDQLALSEQSLKDDATKFADEIEKSRESLSNDVKTDINKAVETVAKAKGLSVVFNKSAGDLILVVYASVDITEDVNKQMAKK